MSTDHHFQARDILTPLADPGTPRRHGHSDAVTKSANLAGQASALLVTANNRMERVEWPVLA
ncbi:hypothetical protein [Novosphingobium sp. AP12]|uniref:hypothetical protein n=1 Tax=Novosphingobium sp. AP12 TaxID=1144305 RepID=UPI000271F1F5|nr:hypothetical protein [Novosphingobium sp. AP12]EJL21440.1 hypothetical protein PMI02_05042 [Novosphingobium sp. AP12]